MHVFRDVTLDQSLHKRSRQVRGRTQHGQLLLVHTLKEVNGSRDGGFERRPHDVLVVFHVVVVHDGWEWGCRLSRFGSVQGQAVRPCSLHGVPDGAVGDRIRNRVGRGRRRKRSFQDVLELEKQLLETGMHLARDKGEVVEQVVEALDVLFARKGGALSAVGTSGATLLEGQFPRGALDQDRWGDFDLLPGADERPRDVVD